ncbi:sn-glycerol-3-phosphate ABC transporter ATP-binding protein UgpC [Marinobacter nanhaiticus D15-8W]|uniref:sn-glycerol-3-phosphate ABC transporter ATP-binding protein UgpC n=1 Tax=Marinobacter nanhaiticus D15-8W TaxID=626887 RepID=N6W4W6_9GAMM|nr:sn-glycerol-3-phosphate ABC transporter ATP-binding protein UgpC [Marinobacter nanhaiticus]ENO15199.1 sn-glycerol-3-phosphate ABC transporter ATP-binding protein UgpC [Marinobacter nanhaiticus D15-8W]BES69099.1 sn-glycerol-3-phosphate ABC transporter ATP-binding protein UgpC [Marinobacter nanhaiticus D15-8W]
MACVELKKINKTFGQEEIIHDIDLRVEDGEFVVFVGPSGCGKSTLLRLVAGLEEITAGTLEIDGETVNELSPKERGVGMVFQSYALYPHMNVFENIAFGLKLGKAGKGKIREWVEKTAEILQLQDLLHRKPRELSGGQRQRVAIGRAMAREPRIMLFDEPLSNLDASLRVQMRTEIAKLHARLRSTMIYVTHDQVEAMTLADKIVVLNKGNIEQVGTPFDLYENPESLFVAGFIGSPKMNLLKGRLAQPGKELSEVALEGIGQVRCACDSSRLQADAPVTLGVRPEHMQLRKPGADEQGLEVINVEYLGNEAYVYLAIPNAAEPLVVRQPVPCPVTEGQYLLPDVKPECAHLFDAEGRYLRRTRAPSPDETAMSDISASAGQ